MGTEERRTTTSSLVSAENRRRPPSLSEPRSVTIAPSQKTVATTWSAHANHGDRVGVCLGGRQDLVRQRRAPAEPLGAGARR
jgi:hypothetical protein